MAEIKLRVSPDLKSSLRALAREDGRSLNNYLTRLLEEHTEDMR